MVRTSHPAVSLWNMGDAQWPRPIRPLPQFARQPLDVAIDLAGELVRFLAIAAGAAMVAPHAPPSGAQSRGRDDLVEERRDGRLRRGEHGSACGLRSIAPGRGTPACGA